VLRKFLPALLLLCLGVSGASSTAQTQTTAETFTNPLLPSGPDPWVIAYKGVYYYTNSTGRNLTLWATPDITDLRNARKKVVWTPPPGQPYSRDLWAPELHRYDGRWYLYFAADDGPNEHHRIYVLENSSEDPLEGTWTLKGQVTDSTDKWAIDVSTFEVRGQRYMIWSGWKGDKDGEQDIFIAHLKNPWTIDSPRVQISAPQYPWERVGDLPDRPDTPHVEVNEGPEILQHGDDLFLVYSASGCWTDYYELGVLHAKVGDDLLNAASWKKYDHPFLQQDRAHGIYGTGHNGFFKSPDGKQDWIIYHANSGPHQGCGNMRSPRAQPFTWNPDGSPSFGPPAPTDVPLPKPSH
jgi:GH43 family beta-xylosidase